MTTSVFTRPNCFAIVAGSVTVSGYGAGVPGARSSPVEVQYDRPDPRVSGLSGSGPGTCRQHLGGADDRSQPHVPMW